LRPVPGDFFKEETRMSERDAGESTGHQPATRPGLISWVIAGAALVALIAFMALK
jgi:hypothetical protein